MKAYVTLEFPALRNPKDRKNSTIEAGEVVEGPLAKWAIENGHGRQVSDDTSVGKHAAEVVPTKAPAKGGKGKSEKAGTSGDGDGGRGGDDK